MLDDLFTYRLGDDRYLTVTNAANHDRDVARFREHAPFEAEVRDRLDDYAMLAVQGLTARGIVAGVLEGELPRRMRTATLTMAEAIGGEALVCGTGYTGEDGVEVLIDPAGAEALWSALLEVKATSSWARRPRHAATRGLLPPLRQRPLGGAQPDRGRARLVLCGGDRFHRLDAGAGGAPTERLSGWRRSCSPSAASRGRATPCSPTASRRGWSRAGRSRRPSSRVGMACMSFAGDLRRARHRARDRRARQAARRASREALPLALADGEDLTPRLVRRGWGGTTKSRGGSVRQEAGMPRETTGGNG